MARFADRLNSLMKEKGVTLQRVADLCKVNKSTVYRWRKGEFEPDTETVKHLARFFNVPVSYLIGETDEQKDEFKTIDLQQILSRNKEQKVLFDGEPIPDEYLDMVYYQLKALKENLLNEHKKKENRLGA